MTKDDLVLLYEYDRWANGRILRAVSSLTPEQFTRDLGGGFRSVRDTLVHIIASEWGWLQYWMAPRHGPESSADLWARCDVLFNPDSFADFGAVRSKWTQVEKEQAGFVNRMTNESLEKTFPVDSAQISLAHLMHHLANHSTYHRGQISMMLRQLDAQPLATDFYLFLAELPPRQK